MTSPFFRFIRFYCLNKKSSRCFYDVLEVDKGASQNQIKSAYIKLSKIHHPDRQNGDQNKFQELSNAYEVLRNQQTREMYDRSIFDSDIYGGRQSPSDRPSPKRPSKPTGPLYNYDEWLRSHYAETLKRRRHEQAARRYAKEFGKEAQRMKRKASREKIEMIMLIMFVISILIIWPKK